MRSACLAVLVASLWSFSSFASDESAAGEIVGRFRTLDGARETVTLRVNRQHAGEGRISGRLGADGERFVGQYLRLNGQHAEAKVRRYYLGWSSDAYDDLRFGPLGRPWIREQYTFEIFRSRHRGAAVATLVGDRGSRMRCRFDLVDPSLGLIGGATGSCQASGGELVEFEGEP